MSELTEAMYRARDILGEALEEGDEITITVEKQDEEALITDWRSSKLVAVLSRKDESDA